MPEVLRFRTTWGVAPGPNYDVWREWFPKLKQQGYCEFILSKRDFTDRFSVGIEIDFAPFENLAAIREICDKVGLEISVLLHTGWRYEPPRPFLTPAGVVDDYREQLKAAQVLRPFNYNAQSGRYVQLRRKSCLQY